VIFELFLRGVPSAEKHSMTAKDTRRANLAATRAKNGVFLTWKGNCMELESLIRGTYKISWVINNWYQKL